MAKIFNFPNDWWMKIRGSNSHLLYNYMGKSILDSIVHLEKSQNQINKTIKVFFE
jgi:hypothetical protein